MRNLKRVLSLALAALMLMGMMVVGAGAASKDFTDASEIKNVEAVDVMVALGILEGGDKGDFQPNSILTREQAAKIICYMLLGEEDADKLTTNYSIFSDVPANRWSAPYISYCVNMGILAGDGAGHFYPEGKLTGVAFAKMLLVALGYNADRENYVGNNWEINVSAAAISTSISPKDLDLSKELSRQDAALMAFNTLQATMVEYKNDNTIIIGGETIVSTTGKASAVRQSPYTDTMSTENLQFAEKYFKDLKKNAVKDSFERPSTNWVYGKTDIGTYLNTKLMVEEYTTEVTGKDLYDLIGSNIIKEYTLTVAIDGVTDSKVNSNVFGDSVMNKNNKQGVGATGNGVLTQVFVDPAKEEITVSIINTYLAFADKDYDEKKEELDITAYGLNKTGDEYVKVVNSRGNTVSDDEAFTLAAEDFDVADFVEGDALLVTVAKGDVQTIAKPKIIADTEITAFKKNTNVTVDGTKYDYADSAEYDIEVLDNYTSSANGTNLKDVTYNVYLDAYDYAIGVDQVSVPDNYLFITGVDTKDSALGNKTAKASAIFLDGTMKTIDINWSKSDITVHNDRTDAVLNTWCTYTVNNDGVYTVKEVVTAAGDATIPGGNNNSTKVAQYHQAATHRSTDRDNALTIDKKNISLNGRPDNGNDRFNNVYGNDSSVYLTAELSDINYRSSEVGIIDGVANVTTGVKNANLTVWNEAEARAEADDDTPASLPVVTAHGVYTLYKSNGYVIAAVVVGEDDAASKNLVYTHTSSVEQESYDKTTGEWTWTRKVVMNGEEVTLTEVSDSSTYLESMQPSTWYQVKLNAEGNVIGVELASTALHNSASTDTADAGEWITEDIDVAPSIKAYDTVLYSEGVKHDKLTMIGSTLYVKTSSQSGFFVREDVKIVLQQLNKKVMETTFETGVDELEDIVASLNKKYDTTNGLYDYTISAILEDGGATTVIIRDTGDVYAPDHDVKAEDYDVQRGGTNIRKVVYYKDAKHDVDTLLDVILADLEKDGYSNFKLAYSNPNYLITATNARGIEFTFSWNENSAAAGLKIKMDGKGMLVESGKQLDQLTGWVGPHAKVTFANGTVKLANNNWQVQDGTDKWDNAVVETGYYKINVSIPATDSFGTNNNWDLVTGTSIPTYAKAGEIVTFQIKFGQKVDFDQTAFARYTFTVSGGATVKAQLATVGVKDIAEPVVTISVTLPTGASMTDNATFNVTTTHA